MCACYWIWTVLHHSSLLKTTNTSSCAPCLFLSLLYLISFIPFPTLSPKLNRLSLLQVFSPFYTLVSKCTFLSVIILYFYKPLIQLLSLLFTYSTFIHVRHLYPLSLFISNFIDYYRLHLLSTIIHYSALLSTLSLFYRLLMTLLALSLSTINRFDHFLSMKCPESFAFVWNRFCHNFYSWSFCSVFLLLLSYAPHVYL